jgi:hypothetical protein
MLRKWFDTSKKFKQDPEDSFQKEYRNKRAVRSVLDGSYFGKETFLGNFLYVIFLAILGVFFVMNTYRSDALVRMEVALKKQNEKLRSKQVLITFQLLKETQLSKVQENIDTNKIGLKVLEKPPFVIELDIDDE